MFWVLRRLARVNCRFFFADLTATRSRTILKYLEPTVLVIVTTCVLADQVALAFRNFLPFLSAGVSFFALYGGVPINAQMQDLRRVDVLVATPGRQLDLVDKNTVRLSSIQKLVLDEADKIQPSA
jgi:superfamily II DNA/RNA helicase